MADQGLSANRSAEITKDSGGVVKLTAADTECAHALLDLAQSFQRTKHQSNNERAVLLPLTSNRSPPRRVTVHRAPTSNKAVSMKTLKARELKASHSSRIDSAKALEMESRVLLDHPYALPPWAREYPRPVDPEFFNLLDAVEGSEESSRPRDSSHTSSGQREVCDKEQRENSPAIPRYMNFYAERSADGRSPTPTQIRRDDMTESADRHNQLYEPDDSKYKNFNLLLKCLTTGNDSPPEAGARSGGGRKRCYSTMETEEGSGIEAEKSGSREVGSSQEARCLHCKKVFSNRAYLKKHTQRMHPNKAEVNGPAPGKCEPGQSGLVTCRRCELRVEATRWTRHRIACGAGAPDHMTSSSTRDSAAGGSSRERLLAASNQSTCQFCGLRMRRQLLVRHLADVHCVEGRAAHASTHPPDSANSDSGSETTLSGSEQESEDIVTCDICLAYVPKALLHQHVLDQHQRHAPEHQREASTGPQSSRQRHSSGYGTDTRGRRTSASTETGDSTQQYTTHADKNETSPKEKSPQLNAAKTSETALPMAPRVATSDTVSQSLPRMETSKVGGRGGLVLPGGGGEPCGQYMLNRYLREHTQQKEMVDKSHNERYNEKNMNTSDASPPHLPPVKQIRLSPKSSNTQNTQRRNLSGFGRYYEELEVSSFPAELPEYARPAFLAQRPRVSSNAN